jgi:hypothetical protein
MRLKHYDNYVDELKDYLFYLLDKEQENTERYKYIEREFKLYTPLELNKNFD